MELGVKLKILIVSTLDIVGGAAKASYRLHKSLLAQNIDSQMLVQNKSSDDWSVQTVSSTKIGKAISSIRSFLESLPARLYKDKTKTIFYSSLLPFSNAVNVINKINPDIVHLHWINGGMIKIEDLSKIKAPIVWSLHDMWAFTGGCHYDEGCMLYKNSCGNCKVLKSNKENDLSKKVFNRKLKIYSKIKNLTIIGSSKWISQCARESFLFKNRNILRIPNCFDTNLFNKIDKDIARSIFNIPKNKKIILFGSMDPFGDPRKGAKELFEAIEQIDIENVAFVIAGSSEPKDKVKLKYPIYFIPPLKDDVSLPLMYNVADVMIVPSLQENLANSIIESLSCGVPVVAFDIGGNSDMINHKKNGYLAKELNSLDMAKGIIWILKNKSYNDLVINAREKALNTFDSKIVSQQYISVYESILGEKK